MKNFRVILISIFFLYAVGVAQSKSAQLSFADGKPWKMTVSDAKGGSIAFNADGTGLMSTGILKMKLSGAQKASFTCINFGSIGEHCVKFLPVPGGFDGAEHGSNRNMSLRRN